MKKSNVHKLRKALLGKTIMSVETHGGHGMVLTITACQPHSSKEFPQRIDICTYEDGKEHYGDEFYVGLNGEEL
jgi:hypothetical protein